MKQAVFSPPDIPVFGYCACGLCYLLRIYESQEIKGLHTALLGLLFKGRVCVCTKCCLGLTPSTPTPRGYPRPPWPHTAAGKGGGGTPSRPRCARPRRSPLPAPSQWRAAAAGGVYRDLTSGTCHPAAAAAVRAQDAAPPLPRPQPPAPPRAAAIGRRRHRGRAPPPAPMGARRPRAVAAPPRAAAGRA